MPREIFISFHHSDRNQVEDLSLLQCDTSSELNFRGRHLLDSVGDEPISDEPISDEPIGDDLISDEPINDGQEDCVWQMIQEQLHGTSVTVVLLGEHTHRSKWVEREIIESVVRGSGVMAIQLKDQNCLLPSNSCVGKALHAAGAEVICWDPQEFTEAIERAAKATGRASSIRRGNSTSNTCPR